MAKRSRNEGKIIRCIRFGLGGLRGYDNRTKQFIDLTELERRATWTALRRASESVGALMTEAAGIQVLKELVGLDAKKVPELKASYVPLEDRIADASRLSSCVKDRAITKMKGAVTGKHLTAMKQGRRAAPVFRCDGTGPIPVRSEGVKLMRDGSDFILLVQVFAPGATGGIYEKGRKSEVGRADLPSWLALTVKTRRGDLNMLRWLDEIVSGAAESRSVELLRREGRGKKCRDGSAWNAILSVAFTPNRASAPDVSVVAGVDLGITKPMVLCVARNGEPAAHAITIGDGRSIIQTRGELMGAKRRALRESRNRMLPASVRDAAREVLKKRRRVESDTIKTITQRLAARVGTELVRCRASALVIEDLSGDVKGGNPWMLRHWPVCATITALEWQAKKLGIPVVRVNPAYTSQTCSKCGHCDRANRPKDGRGWQFFRCTLCGYEANADTNAARNIVRRGVVKMAEATNADA